MNKELAESMGDEEGGYCLTLYEISKQINEILDRTIIEVRVESPFGGVIHQTGNYNDSLWYQQGTTRGYA